MSKKKPWFEDRVESRTMRSGARCKCCMNRADVTQLVRVTDARKVTAEKAVERVLQYVFVETKCSKHDIANAAAAAGMIGTLGRGDVVRVRSGMKT